MTQSELQKLKKLRETWDEQSKGDIEELMGMGACEAIGMCADELSAIIGDAEQEPPPSQEEASPVAWQTVITDFNPPVRYTHGSVESAESYRQGADPDNTGRCVIIPLYEQSSDVPQTEPCWDESTRSYLCVGDCPNVHTNEHWQEGIYKQAWSAPESGGLDNEALDLLYDNAWDLAEKADPSPSQQEALDALYEMSNRLDNLDGNYSWEDYVERIRALIQSRGGQDWSEGFVPVSASVPKTLAEPYPDLNLPGMWERADFEGGETDCDVPRPENNE